MSKQTKTFYIKTTRPIREYTTLGITILYTLGSINYFYNTTNSRGYYISFRPMTITPDKYGNIYSYALFEDPAISFKILVKAANRFNQKHFNSICDFVEKHLDNLQELYENQKQVELYKLVTHILDN